MIRLCIILISLSIPVLLAACGCDRDTRADGVYVLTTDCTGKLVRGTVMVGAPQVEETCPDAGPGTACHAATPSSTPPPDVCGPPTANGAQALGLPTGVVILGDGEFELFGEVDGRSLDCRMDRFGDERMLICRSGGLVACAGIFEN